MLLTALSFEQFRQTEHVAFTFRMETGFPRGNMSCIWLTLALFAIVLCASPVSGNENCLRYMDKNGTWHNISECPHITFCCGNCWRRYCCLDAFKMITEREQKHCELIDNSDNRPHPLAGIIPGITLLFVAIAVCCIMVCCFICSCCYLCERMLYRCWPPYDGQQILMASYPVHMYDAYGKPLGPTEYLHVGYPMAPQYPGMSPQYPVMQPGLYPTQPLDPAYSQAPPPYSPPQYPGH